MSLGKGMMKHFDITKSNIHVPKFIKNPVTGDTESFKLYDGWTQLDHLNTTPGMTQEKFNEMIMRRRTIEARDLGAPDLLVKYHKENLALEAKCIRIFNQTLPLLSLDNMDEEQKSVVQEKMQEERLKNKTTAEVKKTTT